MRNLVAAVILALAVTALPAEAAKRPTVPNPLTGSTSSGVETLHWTNVSGETGYVIERRLVGGSYAFLAKALADITLYKDPLPSLSQYEYRVRAYKILGGKVLYSNYTNTVLSAIATPIPTPTPTPT